MQPKDKINKATWTLFEGAKDTVRTNLTTAIRTGQLKVEAANVQTLLALVEASLDEGYHKGSSVFMKTCNTVFEATEDSKDNKKK